jgi:hypothetical protein
VGNARQIVLFLMASAVWAQPPKLAFERTALHQYEDGPVLDSGYEFVPGENAYFSCRITGYQLARQGEKQSAKLLWTMRVADPSGVLLEKERSGGIESEVLAQDKEWKPKFLASFSVPAFAITGTYRISIQLKDLIAGTEIDTELPFHVRGHDVESSETLVTRNFQFLRAEDDKVPMRNAVYHPGDQLWARFDITGFKFGDNNKFAVDYELAVLNEAGEQLFAQPDAAMDSNESFYPQRYVPGVLSLNLDANLAKASYTLKITVHDKVGNQTWETRQVFHVE